jgi:hypothetical protein
LSTSASAFNADNLAVFSIKCDLLAGCLLGNTIKNFSTPYPLRTMFRVALVLTLQSVLQTYVSAQKIPKIPNLDDFTIPNLDDIKIPSLDNITIPSLDDITIPSLKNITISFDNFTIPSLDDITIPSSDDIIIPPLDDITVPIYDDGKSLLRLCAGIIRCTHSPRPCASAFEKVLKKKIPTHSPTSASVLTVGRVQVAVQMTFTATAASTSQNAAKLKTTIAEQTDIAEMYMAGYTVTSSQVSRRRLLASSYDWSVSYSVSSPTSIASTIASTLNSRSFLAAATVSLQTTITKMSAVSTIVTTVQPTHLPTARPAKKKAVTTASTGAIAGGVIGALGAVVIIGLVVWRVRTERGNKKDANNEVEARQLELGDVNAGDPPAGSTSLHK